MRTVETILDGSTDVPSPRCRANELALVSAIGLVERVLVHGLRLPFEENDIA